MKVNCYHGINFEFNVHSMFPEAAPRYLSLLAILCGYGAQEELDIMAYWRHCDVYFQRPKIIERQSMTIENFQTLIEAHSLRRPFHPFTIELTDGQRFEVDHPLALAYRDNLAFFIGPGAVPHWFDHESVSTILSDTANSAA